MSLLEVNDLYSGYGKVEVLFGISFKIEPGKSLGIVGPNGVGKSTLLKTIVGEIQPKSGSIKLGGTEIKGKNPDEKSVAKLARDFVSSLVLQKTVTLENIQNDKYGRILADVYFEGTHINTLLINERLAVKYDGGKKICPVSWSKFKLTGDMA
jgi:ABC-type branched-subunit amino acid transport system ATPase component